MAGERDPFSSTNTAWLFAKLEADCQEAYDTVATELGYSPFAAAEGTLLDRSDPAQDNSSLSLEESFLYELSTAANFDISAEVTAWLALRERVGTYLKVQHNADTFDQALLKYRLIAAPTRGARSKVSDLFLNDRARLALTDNEYRAIAASMDELGI